MKKKTKQAGKRNPVAKFMNQLHHAEVHRERKKYNRAKENRMARIEASTD